jgi:glutamine synthetase
MPHTLRSALEELLANKSIFTETGVFEDDMIKAYVQYMFETQVWPWEARPHPYEFITSFSC